MSLCVPVKSKRSRQVVLATLALVLGVFACSGKPPSVQKCIKASVPNCKIVIRWPSEKYGIIKKAEILLSPGERREIPIEDGKNLTVECPICPVNITVEVTTADAYYVLTGISLPPHIDEILLSDKEIAKAKKCGLRSPVEKCEQACDSKHAAACTLLGKWHLRGGRGLLRDELISLDYFDKGCSGGDGEACNLLGVLLETNHVQQDMAGAMQAYAQGCRGNDSWACFNLGCSHAFFRPGMSARDPKIAYRSLEKSCILLHNARACNVLGIALSEDPLSLSGEQVDVMYWYEKSCDMRTDPLGQRHKGCASLGLQLVSQGHTHAATTPLLTACQEAPLDDCAERREFYGSAYRTKCANMGAIACQQLAGIYAQDGAVALSEQAYARACEFGSQFCDEPATMESGAQ